MTQNEESTDIENLEPKDAKEIPRQANLAEAEILECLYIQLSRNLLPLPLSSSSFIFWLPLLFVVGYLVLMPL